MTASNLSDQIDLYRLDADRKLSPNQRVDLGQFLTPARLARFMASLFDDVSTDVVLLDPGAGIGSLTSAFVEEMIDRQNRPEKITVDVWELDPILIEYLASTLQACSVTIRNSNLSFESYVQKGDFIEAASILLHDENGLFSKAVKRYTHCIMNPPYRKINSDSKHRKLLTSVGIETSNLYTGFLALAIKLLKPGGELVAIVPRSFCNGVYFKSFRQFFLGEVSIRHLHVFGSRDHAFQDNDVLQENIIFHVIRGGQQGKVVVTSSTDTNLHDLTSREVDFDQIVAHNDPELVINILPSDTDQQISERIKLFKHSLSMLDLEVSTGPVVDFRSREDICELPAEETYPLIYPAHFNHGFVQWPKVGRKPNAIRDSERTHVTLMPNGWYVLARRFSSKEEKRRIVVAIHNQDNVPGKMIGFENHLNVFHSNGHSIDPLIAKGLAIYLSSTLVDLFFRQFSGHTQVNASDLRSLPYPDKSALLRLGSHVGNEFPTQQEVDRLIEAEITLMNNDNSQDPVQVQRRIQEALELLTVLGLPRAQQNERSALTLLALLNLKADDSWSTASDPMIGITPIMEFAKEHYGRQYAPNSRETFRRFTMHQFVQAGIAILNPDRYSRPPNSPFTVYQIEPHVLDLIRHFRDTEWEDRLASYLGIARTLAEQYARQREMNMVPLVLSDRILQLSPGTHSELIKAIIEEFGPRFAPGSEVLYIGDTGAKMVLFNQLTFESLGLHFDTHGKFPDVVLYWRERNWLLLVESVTSHGPVDPKRHTELAKLFEASSAGLVYVTAFPDRQTMARYLGEISWETEVWVADAPSHLIHFNGERFLGPH